MHGLEGFLKDLALTLCAAALFGAIFRRLRQPPVLGYIVAGVVVGPHVPLPLVADMGAVHTLAELGVVLLMFSLGLEFSVRKLIRLGGPAGLITAFDVGLMVWLGIGAGRLFGWGVRECVFAGGIVAISSTMLVARTFAEQGVDKRTRELVYGILIMQDVVAILLVALLAGVAAGGAGPTAVGVALGALKLVAFLLALAGGGMLVVPRLVRAAVHSGNRETMLVTSVGIAFALAIAAKAFGYSAALGAFLAGSIAAESGEGRVLERLVRPLRDLFAALFFVAVGMLIDPGLLVRHAGAIVALAGIVIVGKTAGISLASLATGNGLRPSVRAGMSLAQIGEFSFLVASAALPLGQGAAFLLPVAVGVCVLTTCTTPWMVRASGPLSERLEALLPRRLLRVLNNYEERLQRLRGLSPTRSWTRMRRLTAFVILDAALLAGLLIGVGVSLPSLVGVLTDLGGLSALHGRWVVAALTFLAALPFVAGMARGARHMGGLLALEALRSSEERALRRPLVAVLQVVILAAVGAPLFALVQPFFPLLPGATLLASGLGLAALAFWLGARRFDETTRGGVEMILAATHPPATSVAASALEQVRDLFPEAGTLATVSIETHHAACERTLAELSLRSRTGAAVVSIRREGESILFPDGSLRLAAGDVLVLSGNATVLEAARQELERPLETHEPAADEPPARALDPAA